MMRSRARPRVRMAWGVVVRVRGQRRSSKYLRDPANDPAAQPVIATDINLWPRFLDHVKAGSSHSLGDDLPDI